MVEIAVGRIGRQRELLPLLLARLECGFQPGFDEGAVDLRQPRQAWCQARQDADVKTLSPFSRTGSWLTNPEEAYIYRFTVRGLCDRRYSDVLRSVINLVLT